MCREPTTCMILRDFFPHFSNSISESSGLESKEGEVVSGTSGPESIVTDEALSIQCKLSCGEIGCCGGTGGPRSK